MTHHKCALLGLVSVLLFFTFAISSGPLYETHDRTILHSQKFCFICLKYYFIVIKKTIKILSQNSLNTVFYNLSSDLLFDWSVGSKLINCQIIIIIKEILCYYFRLDKFIIHIQPWYHHGQCFYFQNGRVRSA